jgi:hypothetical protein
MAMVIHLEPQLHKCLNKLRKAGGRAALAAERVEAIIATLASHDCLRPAQVNKLTRHGEARIDNCKKFDLVGGYRLVYVREEHHYFFLFAGTHDDCDRWLNNHRNLKPEITSENTLWIASQPDDVTPAPAQGATASDLDYDAILMKNIDEKMLRSVFRGLCGEE